MDDGQKTNDPVNHPRHYCSHPSGVECIAIIEWLPLNIGNAVKYLWRAGEKENAPTEQDYQKAVWYINREIDRRKRMVAMEAAKSETPEAAEQREVENLVAAYKAARRECMVIKDPVTKRNFVVPVDAPAFGGGFEAGLQRIAAESVNEPPKATPKLVKLTRRGVLDPGPYETADLNGRLTPTTVKIPQKKFRKLVKDVLKPGTSKAAAQKKITASIDGVIVKDLKKVAKKTKKK